MRSFILIICLIYSYSLSAQITVTKLLTENQENPIGLDTSSPRFTWVMASEKSNKSQSAYQVRVSQNEGELVRGRDLLWDSDKIQASVRQSPVR